MTREFEQMVEPPLADRLRAFETILNAEPCLRARNACAVMSNMKLMCAPCRLRLRFFHVLYNAEAYEGTNGAIPRRGEEANPAAGTYWPLSEQP